MDANNHDDRQQTTRKASMWLNRVIALVLIFFVVVATLGVNELSSIEEEEETVQIKEKMANDNNSDGTLHDNNNNNAQIYTNHSTTATNFSSSTDESGSTANEYEQDETGAGNKTTPSTTAPTTNMENTNYSNSDPDETTTSSSSSSSILFEGADQDYEVPIMVYGSLQYHRVCAPVGQSSVVCMTIRYSFEVPMQDPNYSYPRPVDDKFYGRNAKASMIILDGTVLDDCQTKKNQTTSTNTTTIDEVVKQCLDSLAATITMNSLNNPQQEEVAALVIFFRHQQKKGDNNSESGSKISLLGTGTGKQLENALRFFDNQVVLSFGDSTSPAVIECMYGLFGNTCQRCAKGTRAAHCGGKHEDDDNGRRQEQQRKTETTKDDTKKVYLPEMDESYKIFIKVAGYYPYNIRGEDVHVMPGLNLTHMINELGFVRNPGWTKLKELTVMVPYPFAHTQTQHMMLDLWEDEVALQKGFPGYVMTVLTNEGRAYLAELGWVIKRVVVFDGYPQFFPTPTSGFFGLISNNKKDLFVAEGGYPAKGNVPAWSPEYGHDCVGPVPPNSIMTNASRIARDSFQELGLDMRFYVRTWEFLNHFWWMTSGWNGKGGALDCTHGGYGYSCIHKYLLQATIDDYYENLEGQE
jgi:hypothetical protein